MSNAQALNPKQTGIVIVDLQGDFTHEKTGSLAVAGTDAAYLDKVVRETAGLSEKGFKIFATQDYHPLNHISFASAYNHRKPFETIHIHGRTQVLWPDHCVAGTANAEVLLPASLLTAVIKKGMHPEYDSYSGFFDDGGAPTGLETLLKSHQLSALVIYGLATDYCVRATAMDAVRCGFRVILIQDLCRGVAPDTTETALSEMKAAGVFMADSTALQSVG